LTEFDLKDHEQEDIQLVRKEMLSILTDNVATDTAKEKAGRLLARMHKKLAPEKTGGKKEKENKVLLTKKQEAAIEEELDKLLKDV
jgi:hypothetical protein